ncbi:MAG: 16S rRNA (guanine(527)-N(7))-methyltransferase RsmG [Lautropia mirabilis]|nr:16S rRNA (guanine(527)-N(7))-methyltransferase RsmG [Lautropia mirabilis]
MKRRAPAQRSDTTWTDADTQRLQEGLQRLSVTLDEAAFAKVVQWARLLKQWNRTFNLLGNSDSVHLIDEHLLDSLAIVPVLERYLPQPEEALVDVGTGAGFPGILLSIVQPQRPIYLVEPVGKKVAFLRQSVLTLGLKNATVLAGKIEDLESLLQADPAFRKGRDEVSPAPQTSAEGSSPVPASTAFSAPTESAGGHPALRRLISPPHFICRAFTALGRFAALCEPYMSKDSLLFAMKSLRLSEEQQALPDSIMLQAVEPLPTIDLGVQRNLAILSLAGNTPAPDAAQPAAATHPSPPGPGTAASTLTQTTSPTTGDSPATGTPSSTSLPPSAQPNRRRPQ